MKEFDKIYLSWRKGIGAIRFIVGIIQKMPDATVEFQYDSKQVELAKKKDFYHIQNFLKLLKSIREMYLIFLRRDLLNQVEPTFRNFMISGRLSRNILMINFIFWVIYKDFCQLITSSFWQIIIL
jgi:hypothetical protein